MGARVSERLGIHVARVLSPCATGRLLDFYELACLPLGHFYTASTWYRSSVIGFPAGGGTHHRIEWLVRWPDGHDSVVYGAWVGCF